MNEKGVCVNLSSGDNREEFFAADSFEVCATEKEISVKLRIAPMFLLSP